MFSKPKRQHTDRTIKEKLDILRKLDCGVKGVDICKQFNLSHSTLSTWKKQRTKLNEMVDAGKVLDTKRNRESFLPQVERALHLWFSEMRSKPHQLTRLYSLRRQHSKSFDSFDPTECTVLYIPIYIHVCVFRLFRPLLIH